MKTAYTDWEAKQKISSVSPEAHYAELAWNAALRTVIEDMEERGLVWESGVPREYLT